MSEKPMMLVRVIHLVAHVIVLVVWTVIGFLLWVPFLTRMILVFTGAVIATIYRNSDLSKAQRGLEMAVGFYVTGFQVIMASLRGTSRDHGPFEEITEAGTWRVIVEVIIAVAFWVGIASTWYIVGHWGMMTFKAPVVAQAPVPVPPPVKTEPVTEPMKPDVPPPDPVTVVAGKPIEVTWIELALECSFKESENQVRIVSCVGGDQANWRVEEMIFEAPDGWKFFGIWYFGDMVNVVRSARAVRQPKLGLFLRDTSSPALKLVSKPIDLTRFFK